MSVPSVKIGDLALNERGAFKIGPFGSSLKKTELVDAGVPVVGIENILPNYFERGFHRFVAPKKFADLADYEIAPDDVLVTTMGTIGRAAVVPKNLGQAIFDSHLFRMRVDTDRVFPSYLCYSLNSSHVERQLERMARGSIMQGLNTTILRGCEIPLPDLPEQKRIAGLLRQADRLLRTRRYAIELSDTFLPAAFLSLFGAPALAINQQQVCELGAIVTFIDYRGIAPNKVDHGVRLATARNVKRGLFELEPQEFIPAEEYDSWMCRGMPRTGDVLFTTEGHTLGSAAKLPPFEKVALGQRLIALQPSNVLGSDYLLHLVLSPWFQDQIAKRTTGSAARGISSKQLGEIRIPVPPLAQQNHFAALVAQHERLRANQREALRQAEHLFQSLLHCAFTTGL